MEVAMTLAVKNGQDSVQVARAAVMQHGASREELIPILTDISHELGYIPTEAMTEVSRLIGMPKSQLFSVASFYKMIAIRPRGTHVVQFCENAPCHVVGGRQLWQALRDELQLNAGETSPDGKWTLVTTSCLGICAVGPVVVIDDDVYGKVDLARLREILAKYE
jgi:NADH-quinone oxidoreductase subunit E